MVYVFDIDGTICTKVSDGNYENAKPYDDRVKIVNDLYMQGNTIIFQTARGMGRHNNNAELAIADFFELTKNQLSSWGVQYHSLFLGKPAGDMYVDDKALNDSKFFELQSKIQKSGE